jgi:hypothetical protein
MRQPQVTGPSAGRAVLTRPHVTDTPTLPTAGLTPHSSPNIDTTILNRRRLDIVTGASRHTAGLDTAMRTAGVP